jgi:DNA-binding HxlR family transcriptional regulator
MPFVSSTIFVTVPELVYRREPQIGNLRNKPASKEENAHLRARREACSTGWAISGAFWLFLPLEGGTLRFGELKRAIEGISPRVLTLTLRSLERDGLVKRQPFATTPPCVDYSITEPGKSLATAMKPVVR